MVVMVVSVVVVVVVVRVWSFGSSYIGQIATVRKQFL